MKGATEQIAEFIAETALDHIPGEAVEVAKEATLDCVGVILAGSRESVGRVITEYVRSLGSRPEAGVLGGGFKTSAQDAALANGVMGHAMDYDDMHTGAAGHPSVALVPAVLAVGEALHASGQEALAAYVVAFEVIYRIGREIGLKLLSDGYHPTAVWAPLGAAAAAARLLRLDPRQTAMALGIAASEAGGIVGNFGTMTKPFHPGNGARGGVTAALLARAGFTAGTDTFEHKRGFFQVFGHPEGYDVERFTRGLGTDFALAQGMGIKLYPSCGKTHSGIDAMLYLVQRYNLRPQDVDEIICFASDSVPRDALIYSRPKVGLQGKFSMEYCLAAALLDRA